MKNPVLILLVAVGFGTVATMATEEEKESVAIEIQGRAPSPEREGRIQLTFDDATVVETSASAVENMEILAKSAVETEDAIEFSGNVVVKFKAANGEVVKITSEKATLEY